MFFTKLIFDQISDLEDQTTSFARLCYGSLANLSLLTTTQTVIWTKANLGLLLKSLEEFRTYISNGDINSIIQHRSRILDVVRILTNSMLTEENLNTFWVERNKGDYYQENVTKGMLD